MVLEEILVANGASILLLVLLLISRRMTRRYRRTRDRLFTALIWIGIVASFLETFTFLVDGKGGAVLRLVNILGNTLLYACTATVSVIWAWYVDLNLNHDHKRLRRVFSPLLITWGILILLLIGNISGGFFFTVTPDNVYERRPLGYVFYLFLLVSLIISIVLYYRFRAAHGEARFFPIWMFLSPIFVACAVQILFYGLSVAWLGCAIGFVSIYLNLQSKQSLVDRLTGLYNRAYIEHKLIVARGDAKYAYAGIMLDMDGFKKINDAHGHSVGDKALTDAAKILLQATGRDCLVFRFAGDEFIVLVRAEASKPDALEARTLAVEEAIRAGAKAFSDAEDAPYTIAFSMGHALYDTTLGDDVFFHRMDEEMYKEKQRHHGVAAE